MSLSTHLCQIIIISPVTLQHVCVSMFKSRFCPSITTLLMSVGSSILAFALVRLFQSSVSPVTTHALLLGLLLSVSPLNGTVGHRISWISTNALLSNYWNLSAPSNLETKSDLLCLTLACPWTPPLFSGSKLMHQTNNDVTTPLRNSRITVKVSIWTHSIGNRLVPFSFRTLFFTSHSVSKQVLLCSELTNLAFKLVQNNTPIFLSLNLCIYQVFILKSKPILYHTLTLYIPNETLFKKWKAKVCYFHHNKQENCSISHSRRKNMYFSLPRIECLFSCGVWHLFDDWSEMWSGNS